VPTLSSDRSAELLIAAYERAELDLRRLIQAATLRGATGTAAYFERQRVSAHRALAELRAVSPALVVAAVRGSYDAASEATSASLGFEHGFSGVDRQAVAVAVRALHGQLDGSLITVGRSVDDVFRRLTVGEVAQHLIKGDTKRASSARLRAALLAEGLTAFRDRTGRRWKLDVYSRMAIVTTTRQVGTAAVVNRMHALGEDLVQWSSHVNPCPICQPFDGNTYSLSGERDDYPKATLLPPGHPNCRHVLTPAAVSFEEFERELGLAGGDAPTPAEAHEHLHDAGPDGPDLGPPVDDEPEEEHAFASSVKDSITPEAGNDAAALRLNQAARYIDMVHRTPANMAPITFDSDPSELPANVPGQYTRIAPDSPDSPGLAVGINVLPDAEANTVVHELGHYLDHKGLFGDQLQPASEFEPAFQDLWDAMDATPTIKRLRAAVATGTLETPDGIHVPINARIKKHIRYLLRRREMFARAYESWVIFEATGQPAPRHIAAKGMEYFPPSEYASIAAAMERLFRSRGLRP
jgi:hypothetical protein